MKKRICVFFYCIFLCIFTAAYINAQAIGDSNNDGVVNIVDALRVAQYAVGLSVSNFIVSVSDVNADGAVNIIDALMIAQKYVGLISTFPAEKWNPYIVTPAQTEITIKTGTTGTDAAVALTFPSSGYRVADWGAVTKNGMEFSVNALAESWPGPSLTVLITLKNTYTLGKLADGNYTFIFKCRDTVVKRVPFTVSGTSIPAPANLAAVKAFEPFDAAAESMLLNNGFVVLGKTQYANLSSRYFSLFGTNTDVPVLITTDALLHIFHMVYDNTLKTMEKKSLAPKMENLISLILAECINEYTQLEGQDFLQEAARKLWIVFAVGDALIKGQTAITGSGTEPVQDEANQFLTKVYNHSLTEYYPGDDFTIYAPRGHYAGDPILEQYFRAVKWVSRRIFRIYDPVNTQESEYELAGAAILAFTLTHAKNNALPLWEEIYDVTSLLIDSADSITPAAVEQALNDCFGSLYSQQKYLLLSDHANLVKLRDELLSSKYPESEIIPVPLPNPGALPKKYVQFMGERYVIDGEAMQRTCFPDVADRTLPTGLDIAATVLTSESAYNVLKPEMVLYPGLQTQVDTLKNEFNLLPEEKWMRSTYNYWLYTLKSLSPIPAGSVPPCMKGALWQLEKLNTQLASWTELRHDNILYAKQTMVPAPWNQGHGLVEPYPLFYSRLAGMCNQLIQVIDTFALALPTHKSKLQTLSNWCTEFTGYAAKIVSGVALTTDEQSKIKRWGLDLLGYFSSTEIPEDEPELIVDVASSSITGEVLHEAVGRLNPLILIYTDPADATTRAAVGYVMSYYELIETNWNRLNDDEWKKRLASNPQPRPAWTSEYCQQ